MLDFKPKILFKCLRPQVEFNDDQKGGVVGKDKLERFIHLTVKCMIPDNEGWEIVLEDIKKYTKINVVFCVRENGRQNRPHIHLLGVLTKKVNPKMLQNYLNKKYNKTEFNCYSTYPEDPLGEVWEYMWKEQGDFID